MKRWMIEPRPAQSKPLIFARRDDADRALATLTAAMPDGSDPRPVVVEVVAGVLDVLQHQERQPSLLGQPTPQATP
jgi:hypothetical protein